MTHLSTRDLFDVVAPEEGFILDLLPEDPRIVIESACSGHGFKFAPLTGRILSELALHGKTTVQEFEEFKSLFSFPKVLAWPTLCHKVRGREALLSQDP